MSDDETSTENIGKTVLTNQLTPDQRGWARERHPNHYRTNGAKWFVNKDKPAVPTPVEQTEHKPRRRRIHYA